MPTLLAKNIELLAARREIRAGALVVRDNLSAQLARIAAEGMPDPSGRLVMRGMVDTHHHMCQNLTWAMVQNDELFVWPTTLYPISAKLGDEVIDISACVAMAELMQSGCTTGSDHRYIRPNNCTIDSEIRAAQRPGLRSHAARGAMPRGRSEGGLLADGCVERGDAIRSDAERLIHRYHGPFRVGYSFINVRRVISRGAFTELDGDDVLARPPMEHLPALAGWSLEAGAHDGKAIGKRRTRSVVRRRSGR
jgi:cytosine/adenosine deaminase-related metal-dependent hydrolase